MQNFTRVYQMLDFVEQHEGPFNYCDASVCLFGIGRRSASFWFRITHPFQNGGHSAYGRYLGLTRAQHWCLYTDIFRVARDLGIQTSTQICEAYTKKHFLHLARSILVHWEMQQLIADIKKPRRIHSRAQRETLEVDEARTE